MVRTVFWSALLASIGVLVVIVPSPAADPPKGKAAEEASKAEESQAANVELLTEAYKMAEIAEAQKLPEAYVAAGGLLLKLHAQTNGKFGTLDVQPEVLDANEKPIPGAKVETLKPESLKDIAQGFFDSATLMASDQKVQGEVDALVKKVKAREAIEKRGSIGGPKWFVRPLGPGQTHVYNINFNTYSVAAIGFNASAPTRCKMTMNNNVHFNQVVTSGQYTWKPAANSGPVKTFTITVHNPRNVAVTYKLVTN